MSPLPYGSKLNLGQSAAERPRVELPGLAQPGPSPIGQPSAVAVNAELARLEKQRETIQQYIDRKEAELQHTISWLQTHLPDDELARMQSEAIVGLYYMVKKIWESEAVLASMLPHIPKHP